MTFYCAGASLAGSIQTLEEQLTMYNQKVKLLCTLLLSALTYAGDNEKLALPFGSDTRWQQYTRAHYKPSHEIELHEVTYSPIVLAVSVDHQKLLYKKGLDSSLYLIDLNSGDRLMKLENPLESESESLSLQSVAFSADGKTAVFGGGEYPDLSFWDELLAELGIKKLKMDWTLHFWNLARGKQIGYAKGHNDFIRSVTYSPVDNKALTGGDRGDILLWDLENMQVLKRFVGHSSGIRPNCLIWAQDGKTFVSGSWDGSIRRWDIQTGKEIANLNPGYGRVMSLALSPDGKYAISSYLNGPNQPVILWDLQNQHEINRFGVPGNPWFADQQLHVVSVAFSTDGKTALFGLVFGTVIWWDLNECRQIAMNRLHKYELAFVTFSADGKSSISIGFDIESDNAKMKFWQLPNRDVIKERK